MAVTYRTSDGFHEWRTARRRHCCSDCGREIQPGQTYLLSSAPPNGGLGNESWWRLKTCRVCNERYGRTPGTNPAAAEEASA